MSFQYPSTGAARPAVGQLMLENHQPMQHSPVEVLKFVLVETGTYDDIHRRPFVGAVTPDNLLRTHEAAQSGQLNNIVQAIPHLAMTIVPSDQSQGVVMIPNGWSTRRFRFMLTVKTVNNIGIAMIETVLGYTEFSDQSMSGLLDPNMVFYINSIQVERASVLGDMSGSSQRYIQSDVIIAPPNMNYDGTQPSFIKQRAEDVVQHLDTSMYLDEGLSQQFTVDQRNRLTAIPIRSRREEQSAAGFIGGIITAVSTAKASADGDVTDADDIRNTALGQLRNSNLQHGGFMYALSRLGYYMANQFTLAVLESMDPAVRHKVQLVPTTPELIATLPQVGQAQDMLHGTEEMLASCIIASGLPPVMARFGMNRVAFMMDNQSHQLTDMRYVDPNATTETLQRQANAFLSTFRSHVFAYISYANQQGVRLIIEADVMGDTYVAIGLESSPMVPFTFPTFCDALSSPVITPSMVDNAKLVADVGELTSAVSSW